MGPKKRLIVTADDVGLAPGMTAGALRAHREGIVTAVSVAAAGRAFDAAVAELRDHPGLDVGIHWTLVEETPLSPARQVRSLLTAGGAPLPGFRAFAQRYLLGRLRAAEVEAELRRQTERLLDTGLAVVHANGHQHLHLLPGVFEIALRLVREYRIPFLRIPLGALSAGSRSRRGLELAVLQALGGKARRRIERNGRHGPAFAGRTIGIFEAGHLTPSKLDALFSRVESQAEGVTELVCHPGQGDAALAALYPTWNYGWDAETAALCGPGLVERLAASGIEPASFSRLPLPVL